MQTYAALRQKGSVFREEISACAVVHTCYVMDACDHVRPIILLFPIMGDKADRQ